MIHGQTHIKFTLHVFVSVDPKDPYSKKKLGMCKKATLSVKILPPPPKELRNIRITYHYNLLKCYSSEKIKTNVSFFYIF